MKYLHVSKELIVVPKVALGTDGKPVIVEGEFEYRLARDGVTYKRPSPKPLSKRDLHRISSGTYRSHDWVGSYG